MSQRRYGAVLSYASLALSIGVAFFLTPLLVQALGKGQYGLFSLISSIVMYFLLADVGLNDTVMRYIVRYMRTSREELGVFLGATLVGYGVIVTVMLAAAAVGYGFLTPQHWPRLTPEELADLRFMYVVGMGSAAAILLANPFGAILTAHQRFIVLQILSIAATLLSFTLVVLYVRYGHSVRTVFVLNTAVQAAVCLAQIVYVLVVIRPPILLRRVSLSYVREKLNFAGPIFIVVIVEMIYWRLDNIIIGAMVGTVGLAVFSIGILFQKYVQKLATTISKVWLPRLIHHLEGGLDPEGTTLQMAGVGRLQMIILLPVVAGVVFFGRDFLRLWLGPDFLGAYPIMLLTLIPTAVELIGNIRNTVMQVRGLYWQRAAATILFAVLNVVVTVLLIPRVGIVGAAVGTGAGVLCGYVYVQWLMRTKADYLPWMFYRTVLRGIWIVTVALAVIGLALGLWPTANWFDFVAKGAIFTGVYALLVWLVGMNKTERGYFLSFARDAGLVRP